MIRRLRLPDPAATPARFLAFLVVAICALVVGIIMIVERRW
jgi:hypothetical protein